uniref:J domain-containing protein n=1 Tax=Macrostomum lignano TaxID=282301 RepID=A0A1I8I457_9PLAT
LAAAAQELVFNRSGRVALDIVDVGGVDASSGASRLAMSKPRFRRTTGVASKNGAGGNDDVIGRPKSAPAAAAAAAMAAAACQSKHLSGPVGDGVGVSSSSGQASPIALRTLRWARRRRKSPRLKSSRLAGEDYAGTEWFNNQIKTGNLGVCAKTAQINSAAVSYCSSALSRVLTNFDEAKRRVRRRRRLMWKALLLVMLLLVLLVLLLLLLVLLLLLLRRVRRVRQRVQMGRRTASGSGSSGGSSQKSWRRRPEGSDRRRNADAAPVDEALEAAAAAAAAAALTARNDGKEGDALAACSSGGGGSCWCASESRWTLLEAATAGHCERRTMSSPTTPTDLYGVLGVGRTANSAEIEAACSRLYSKRPRVCPAEVESPESQRDVMAMCVLSDPVFREVYDRVGEAACQGVLKYAYFFNPPPDVELPEQVRLALASLKGSAAGEAPVHAEIPAELLAPAALAECRRLRGALLARLRAGDSEGACLVVQEVARFLDGAGTPLTAQRDLATEELTGVDPEQVRPADTVQEVSPVTTRISASSAKRLVDAKAYLTRLGRSIQPEDLRGVRRCLAAVNSPYCLRLECPVVRPLLQDRRIVFALGLKASAAPWWPSLRDDVRRFLAGSWPRVVAVGEVELNWDAERSQRQDQLTAAMEQFLLAKEFGLPVLFRVEGGEPAWAVALGFLRQPEFQAMSVMLAEDLDLPEAVEAALVSKCHGVFFEVSARCRGSPRAVQRAKRLPRQRLLVTSAAPFGGDPKDPTAIKFVPEALADSECDRRVFGQANSRRTERDRVGIAGLEDLAMKLSLEASSPAGCGGCGGGGGGGGFGGGFGGIAARLFVSPTTIGAESATAIEGVGECRRGAVSKVIDGSAAVGEGTTRRVWAAAAGSVDMALDSFFDGAARPEESTISSLFDLTSGGFRRAPDMALSLASAPDRPSAASAASAATFAAFMSSIELQRCSCLASPVEWRSTQPGRPLRVDHRLKAASPAGAADDARHADDAQRCSGGIGGEDREDRRGNRVDSRGNRNWRRPGEPDDQPNCDGPESRAAFVVVFPMMPTIATTTSTLRWDVSNRRALTKSSDLELPVGGVDVSQVFVRSGGCVDVAGGDGGCGGGEGGFSMRISVDARTRLQPFCPLAQQLLIKAISTVGDSGEETFSSLLATTALLTTVGSVKLLLQKLNEQMLHDYGTDPEWRVQQTWLLPAFRWARWTLPPAEGAVQRGDEVGKWRLELHY